MERKEFLLSLGLGAGWVLVGCCLGGCSKSGDENGSPSPSPQPPPSSGNKVDFMFDVTTDATLAAQNWTARNNVIIAKSGAGYLAFEGFCPHQSAEITFNSANNTFPCSNTAAGHGSVFDATGKK